MDSFKQFLNCLLRPLPFGKYCMMAKKTNKISNNQIVNFALMALGAVVLVKLYNTADTYQKLAKKIDSQGLIRSL
jgi:hypothetical protein